MLIRKGSPGFRIDFTVSKVLHSLILNLGRNLDYLGPLKLCQSEVSLGATSVYAIR